MSFVNQAEFARLHKVSRKAVTTWKNRGYLTFSGKLVNVEKSNDTLARIGRAWPKVVTSADTGCGPVTQRAGSIGSEPASLSAMCDGGAVDMAELVLRHLPIETVRPLVEEFLARQRHGAIEMLDENEDGTTPPPPGYASWADHPAFTDPILEHEWREAAEAAAVHVQAAEAAPRA